MDGAETTSIAQTEPLYERVARQIEELIDAGTLRPGERIPSVRKLRQQLGVSATTVIEAYRRLEGRGLISARPQSGYYVRRPRRFAAEPPARSTPPAGACRVAVRLLAMRLNSKVADRDVVKLGAALPGLEFLPTRALNRVTGQILRRNPVGVHGYAPPLGFDELRREIARRMLDAGCTITPEEVIITNGAQEAASLALRAVTRPGDTVAVASPTYYAWLEMLEAMELRACEIPTDCCEGIDLDAFERVLARGEVRACALIANFGNPLGSRMPDELKARLASLLGRYDVPLVEDDVYGDLYFEGTRPKALRAFDDRGLVLYCSSFSKSLSPGMRVGWCVPGRFQARLEHLKLTASVTTGTLPQMVMTEFLRGGAYDRHLRKLRRTYRDNVLRMSAAVVEHFPGPVRLSRPEGGQVLWVELPQDVCALRLYDDACGLGISIAPGPMFSAAGQYQNFIRLNCGLPWSERVEDAVRTLGRLMRRQLPDGTRERADLR